MTDVCNAWQDTAARFFFIKIYSLYPLGLRSDDMNIVSYCNAKGLFVTRGRGVDMVTRALLFLIRPTLTKKNLAPNLLQ